MPPFRLPALLWGVLLLTGLSACSTFRATDLASFEDMPRTALIDSVPFVSQEQYYCGPATLAMVLGWSGEAVTQEEIANAVFTPGREGAFRSDMLGGARRYGKLAVPVSNLRELLTEIEAGHPVIVFQNNGLSWWPAWHYAVAVGYDLGRNVVILHSGEDEYAAIGLPLFERTWRRGDNWALAVLPPENLPVTAGETDVLQAAAGLERVSKYSEAATAYEAALQKWPDSWLAAFGLGNTYYAKGEYAAASDAFRRSIAINPNAHQPWNNLSLTLMRQDKKTEALEAIQQAIVLSNGTVAAYQQTLREIERNES